MNLIKLEYEVQININISVNQFRFCIAEERIKELEVGQKEIAGITIKTNGWKLQSIRYLVYAIRNCKVFQIGITEETVWRSIFCRVIGLIIS